MTSWRKYQEKQWNRMREKGSLEHLRNNRELLKKIKLVTSETKRTRRERVELVIDILSEQLPEKLDKLLTAFIVYSDEQRMNNLLLYLLVNNLARDRREWFSYLHSLLKKGFLSQEDAAHMIILSADLLEWENLSEAEEEVFFLASRITDEDKERYSPVGIYATNSLLHNFEELS